MAMIAPEGAQVGEVVGRVVFDESKPIEDIRRLALNEALYLAALQAGAAIDGYSALDSQATLSESLIVRPAAEVLDYTILEEGRKGEHYEMRLRVATSAFAARACPTEYIRHVELFKPQLHVSENAPAWARGAVRYAFSHILTALNTDPNVRLRENIQQAFDMTAMQKNGGSLHYNALMSSHQTKSGDYAVVPQISLGQEKERLYGLVDKHNLILRVKLDVFKGPDFKKVATHHYEKLLMGSFDSFVEPINVLANPGRDDRLRDLTQDLRSFVEAMLAELACLPRAGHLARIKDQFYVPLGRRHGLREMQLAVIADAMGGWALVQIAALEEGRAYVVPLDAGKDLAGFVGQETRFMEIN